MSDISKVLGLPRETKKPSTLKKRREPPAPKYIDKQRAIAIARQLKIGKIGKVSLRVSDRTSLDSEIPRTSEKASRTLSRRLIIDHTKGMQTATITKDSAVGKCIMGPIAYHGRRLATKMDKLIEDEEKRRSMLTRKTREFKQQQKKAIPDPKDLKKQLEMMRRTPPGGRLPSLNRDDIGTPDRRSKSPGYMRPLSCNRTRSTETQVAEAEAFLNSNVIRATLEAPTSKATARALDLVEASNTDYVRPKSGSKYDDDSNSKGQFSTESDTNTTSVEDTKGTEKPDQSNKRDSGKSDGELKSDTTKAPFSNSKPSSPSGNRIAGAAITLLQNKNLHEAHEQNPIKTKPSDNNEATASSKQQNMNKGQSFLMSDYSTESINESESSKSKAVNEHDVKSDTNLLQQTGQDSSNKSANGLPNKFANATRKTKHKPSFMETILDESPISSAGKRTPRLETSLSRTIITRASALSSEILPVHSTDDETNTSPRKSPPSSIQRRTSSLKRAATVTAQIIALKNTTRRTRRKKNVAFSKTIKETLAENQPGYTVTDDPRFLNLTTALIPDSAGSRHLYDEMSTETKPYIPQSAKGHKQNSVAYSRRSENLAKFEELFEKCQV